MIAPDQPARSFAAAGRFLIAYAFWLLVMLTVVVAIWVSSSGLSTFRYAGF